MFEEVRAVLGQALHLGDRTTTLQVDTRLLGEMPELDSMAIVTIITSLEETYGFTVEDDEISADTFFTLGTVVEFVERKVAE